MLVQSFLALLVVGLVYWKLTRIFSVAMKIKEPANPVVLKWGGRLYFLVLSYCFFWLLFSIPLIFDAPETPEFSYYFYSAIISLLSIVLTVVFYKLCVRQFVIKPLKAMHQSPQDFNNGSPGCSGTEPGDKGDQQPHQHY